MHDAFKSRGSQRPFKQSLRRVVPEPRRPVQTLKCGPIPRRDYIAPERPNLSDGRRTLAIPNVIELSSENFDKEVKSGSSWWLTFWRLWC